MSLIALEDLSVAVGDFRLDRISLEAGDGEYLILLGPSGAGKTMLLEVIAGLRIPDTGTVTINGLDVGGVSPEYRGTGLVYQDYSLFPHMTAAENIAFGLKLQKKPVKVIQERVDTLLADLGISLLKDRYPGSMSGGEQQRVAIARALAPGPSVLLLDEPFASLDPRNRDECMRVMQKLKDTRSITIIQVSHSGEEAYALADKVAVLLGGRVVQTGPPDEIFCRPVSLEIARFVGMENVFTGTVVNSDRGSSRISIGTAEIQLPATYPPGDQISIGIPAGSIKVVSSQPVLEDPGTNSISCQVRNVTLGKDTVTIRLEGAIPLTAMVKRISEEGNIPVPGIKVYAVFKDTDVQVLSGASLS
ncbi:MAG: ABC transporter ATP-binding protein [Methanoregula sp.]|nr:ABC transporter ATP-binding protein [Methanoregula sp.]